MIAKPLLVLALAAARPRPPPRRPARPPGPPPGNGTDLPASPGTAPAFVPPGCPGAIPDATGPGLLDGRARRAQPLARARSRCGWPARATERSACARRGSPRRSSRATRYRCAGGRATARLKVTSKIAKRLVRRRTVAATGIVRQGGRDARVYFELTAGRAPAPAKGFWTDGHLQCAPGYLVEPDFTAKSTIPISTRGWVAWYTAAGGWHWLGSGGENVGRWNAWTASASGVEQFHPNGTPSRCPGRWGRSPSRPAAASTPSASTRSSTGSAAGRTTSGSTSTRARPAPSPPVRATHYCVYP